MPSLPITSVLQRYLQAHTSEEPDLMRQLREKTQALGNIGNMHISPYLGQFIRLLVHLLQAKKVLEIGTFTGYSAAWIAGALTQGGRLVTCDVNETWTAIAKDYWQAMGISEKIELVLAPALQTCQQMLANGEQNSIDFIFIDADKSNYVHYYQAARQLIRAGGLIMIDNTLWQGRVADPQDVSKRTQAIRDVNTAIKQDDTMLMCLLPMFDGVTLVSKK